MVRHPDRILKADKDFHDVVEYVLVYAREPNVKIAKLTVESDLEQYVYEVTELTDGNLLSIGEVEVLYFTPKEYKVVKKPVAASNLKRISIRGSLKEGNSSGRFYEKYLGPGRDKFPPHTLFKVRGIGNDGLGYRYFYTPNEGRQNGGYYQGVPVDYSGTKEKPYANFMDFVEEYNSVGYEGNIEFRNAKKPEAFLMKIFEIAEVKPGDVVLDFFVGSGTTAAVAHKLGVQYVGVEQMDYGENDSIVRLKNVVEGEQGGISEDVEWEGGGGFVCCDLMQWNQRYVDRIEKVTSTEELEELRQEMQAHSFLSYKVDVDAVNEYAGDFKDLALEEQKHLVLEMLDHNALYVNLTEIDDIDYGVSEEDKRLNAQFYGREQ